MKHIKTIDQLQAGDVVLLAGYDWSNYTSGDANGWYSHIVSLLDPHPAEAEGHEKAFLMTSPENDGPPKGDYPGPEHLLYQRLNKGTTFMIVFAAAWTNV